MLVCLRQAERLFRSFGPVAAEHLSA